MSILYKGLNPKHHYGLCILTINGELITANGKHFQAIQIPTPHGRLIDADALELEKEVELADDWKTAHEIANCVKYAPTILEAEESDEHNT